MSKLNIGTVIKATEDWSIRDIADDQNNVIITAAKPYEGTYNKEGSIVTPLEHRDDYNNGDDFAPPQGSNRAIKDEIRSLSKRAEETGISLQDKYFIIMTVNGFGVLDDRLRQNTKFQSAHTVAAALECTEEGEIIKDGLSIEFEINTSEDPYLRNKRGALNNPQITCHRTLSFN
jgi:hypothetical protein